MDTVEILPISKVSGEKAYRASSAARHATGKTPGQALDALIALSEHPDFDCLVVTRRLDDQGSNIDAPATDGALFTSEQQDRLRVLMGLWQEARDQGQTLSPEQKTELEALVEAELLAENARTEALLQREIKEKQL